MTKEQAKEMIVEMFTQFVEQQKKLSGIKVDPRDFDCFVSGFIAAASFNSKYIVTEEDVTEIVDHLIDSDIAKKVGVTGTTKQSFEFYQYGK